MISQVFQQNEPTASARRLFFYVVDSSMAPVTGVTGTVKLSKIGGTGAASSASLTEFDSTNFPGWYYVILTTGEVDTLGPLIGRIPAGVISSNLTSVSVATVIPFDPNSVDKSGFALSSAGNNAVRDVILTDATAFPGANVAAIKAKTDNLPASPAAVSDIPTAAANATALLDTANGVETSVTPRQSLKLMLAALVGKVTGMDTGSPVFRNVGDTKNRISATVDANGNRTAVTIDAT